MAIQGIQGHVLWDSWKTYEKLRILIYKNDGLISNVCEDVETLTTTTTNFICQKEITQYKKNKNNLTSGRLPGSQTAICAGRPCYR